MPYKVKVIKASMRDSDGSVIGFDLLAGDYNREQSQSGNTVDLSLDDLFNSTPNPTGSDNDGV